MIAYLVHISAGVLVELVAAAEDDQSYFTVTQDGQLVCLLHHSKLSLVEGHLQEIWIREGKNITLIHIL